MSFKKSIVSLLLSIIFLFIIFTQTATATHIASCSSVCGGLCAPGLTCLPGEECCPDPDFPWCEGPPNNCPAPPTPTPTVSQNPCGDAGGLCRFFSCNAGETLKPPPTECSNLDTRLVCCVPSSATPAPAPCTDNDPTNIPTFQGTCTESDGFSAFDTCTGSGVTQFQCSGSSCVSSGTTACAAGCSSGACVSTTPTPTPTLAPCPFPASCQAFCLPGETPISKTTCEPGSQICCSPGAPPTPAPTATPQPSCTGNISLTLVPDTAVSGQSIQADAAGLTGCSGKEIFFGDNNCPPLSTLTSCISGPNGCRGFFSAPTASTFIDACIDFNNDGAFIFSDGERDSGTLTITAGTTPTIAPPGTFTISGSVWVDSVIENCAIDPPPPQIPLEQVSTGATVTALNVLNLTSSTKQTDITGAYSFSGLSAGDYTISVSQPGYFPSKACPSKSVNLGPDQSNIGLAIVLPTPTPTPTPPPAVYKIEGLVYIDSNKDKLPTDATGQPEKAYSGATVTADPVGLDPLAATTDADLDGNRINYSFTDLDAITYEVKLTVPHGFKLTTPGVDFKTLSATAPSGRVDFGIADNTPPTISVDHSPSSPKDNCQVTVTATARDSESGLKRVYVNVDLTQDGDYDDIYKGVNETKVCPSPIGFRLWLCELELPVLPTGTYKYYGAAEDNAKPDPELGNTSSTTPKEFTVTATKGTLQCLEASGCKCTKISTAIGPIDVAPAAFVSRIMSLLLGLGGGIAVLLIIAAGYSLITSRDNPQTVQDARERILAAIVGLLFVIFALVILQVIGFDILRIPGFVP